MNDVTWYLIFSIAFSLSILILIPVQKWRDNDEEDVTKIWVARGVLAWLPLIMCGGCYLCFEKTNLIDLVRPFYNSLGDIGKCLFWGGLISIGSFLLALLVGTLWDIADANSLKELEERKEVRKKIKAYERSLKRKNRKYNNE